MRKTKNKFNALTPGVLDENKTVYNEALDYAFSNKDIKNIAITGIYGAGKSTVWKTYTDKKNFQALITVSLGKYEDNIEGNSASENLKGKYEENRVERQLINQLLSQVKSSEIPLSKYRFKENKSIRELCFLIIMTCLFILSMLIWLTRESLNDVCSNEIIYLSGLTLFLIPSIVFLYSFYKENKMKLLKINLKGAEADFKDENNDETVLDRDIKEIVYIIESSKTEIIVFEDLDRYDNIEIFTKLRELNFLLNSYAKTSGSNRTIRFVYMLKDGLFFSKNRTKFFDFILPIVPVVDSKTSENKLIELLNCIDDPPDRNVLMYISLYVDDMRLLKNIVNEYVVYSEVIPIEKIDLKEDKLFALITLKNIFPNEYDLLQEDKGYIRLVFDKLEKMREEILRNLQNKVIELQEEITLINERNKFEAMALMIPADVRIRLKDYQESKTWAECLKEWSKDKEKSYYIYFQYTENEYKYEEFVNNCIATTNERETKIKKLSEEKEEKINRLNSDIQRFEKEKRDVDIYSFKELISRMNSDQREELFLSENHKITEDHYFPLIRFLIVEGLLDETYWYYKGNFDVDTSETLKRNDTIYMKGLLEGISLDVFLDVETPTEVISRLGVSDFNRFNILNKNIFEQCLENNDKESVIKITNSVSLNKKYEDLVKIIDVLELETTKKYVDILWKENGDTLTPLLDLCEGTTSAFQNIIISIFTNTRSEVDKLALFSSYLEENYYIISLILEERFETFIKNITSVNIKFQNLTETKIDTKKLKKIVNIKAYKLDVLNTMFITRNLLNKSIRYGNLLNEIYQSGNLCEIKKNIEDNFVSFITQYIEGNINNDFFTNTENILVEILISDVSDEYKIKYVSKNDTVVTDVKRLEIISQNEEIFKYLLDGDKVKFSKDNIDSYWDMIESYTVNFVNYIDRNINDDNAEDILNNNKSICNSFVEDSSVSDKLFKYVLSYADKKIEKIDSDLSKERINELIQNNLIEGNADNITFLKNNNYNKEIVMLANSENRERENDVILQLLDNELSKELIYMLVNSKISDENAGKLVDTIKDSVLIEKINPSRKSIICNVISSKLSDDNITYICNNFATFQLQDEFIEVLDSKNILSDLDNKHLTEDVLHHILKNKDISKEVKIDLIIIKIRNKTGVEQIKQYISTVEEISNVAEVWNKKYPLLDNVDKEKIGKELIDANYIKKRKDGKIMVNKDKTNNMKENHLLQSQ